MYFIHTPIVSSPDLAEPRWTRRLPLSCIRRTREGSLLLDTLTCPKTGTFAGSQRHAVTWLLTAAGVPEHLLNVYSIIPGRGFVPELAANQSNPHLLQPLQYATKNCLYCTGCSTELQMIHSQMQRGKKKIGRKVRSLLVKLESSNTTYPGIKCLFETSQLTQSLPFNAFSYSQ